MFSIVALPYDALKDLPTPTHRWLMTCLMRYADRGGRAFPTERQLAFDARLSPATVCRYLKDLDALGAFERVRQGIGRYVYTLAERFRPRWKPKQNQRVSQTEHRVSQGGTQKANPSKQEERRARTREIDSEWTPRLRSWQKSRFWLPYWGPKPGEPGCLAPVSASTSS